MKRILAIRLGAIGDVILASAPLLNLKLSFPQAEIFFLTRADIVPLAEMMAGADRVLPFVRHASPLDLFRIGEYLDSFHFDMLLDLHGNIRSAYLLNHVAASRKIKYRKRRWERWAAARLKIINPDPPHTIDLYNDAVIRAGGKAFAKRAVIKIPVKQKSPLPFGGEQPVIALAPGASYRPKQWPKERFAALAVNLYRQLGCHIVLILSSRDIELETLRREIPESSLAVYLDTPLEEIAGVLSQCRYLVSNDSGLMHLGSAVGVPVVALFGPTHPTLGFWPRGLHDKVIQRDEPCRPCSLHGRLPCYREEQYCFTRITPGDVFKMIREGLEANFGGNKAVFIDRDGTLIKEKEYLSDPDQVEPIAGSFEALKKIRAAGYKVIVVSNQSGVARGYYDEGSVRRVNERIVQIYAAEGIIIDEMLYCPYMEGASVAAYNLDSPDRKPAPGMVEAASLRQNINPGRSFVIGDMLTDIGLAHVCGARGILVRTGHGRDEEKKLISSKLTGPEIIVDNLFEGVKYILEN